MPEILGLFDDRDGYNCHNVSPGYLSKIVLDSADCVELAQCAKDRMAAVTAEVVCTDISFKATAGTTDAEGNRCAVGTMAFMNDKVEIMGLYSLPDLSATTQERLATILNERNIRLTKKAIRFLYRDDIGAACDLSQTAIHSRPTANHMDEDAMRIANRAAVHSEQEIEAMLQELRTTRCIPRPEDVIPAMRRVIDEFKDCFDTNLQSLLLTPAAMKTIQLQMQLVADGHLSDPMPMWEMVTRRCGNQLYIFITKRGTEKLEGFHKHLKEAFAFGGNFSADMASRRGLLMIGRWNSKRAVANRGLPFHGTHDLRAIERLNDVCHQAGWPSWDPLCEKAPPTSEGFFFDYVPQEAAPHLLQALQAAAGPAHSHPSPEYVEGGDDRLVELIAGLELSPSPSVPEERGSPLQATGAGQIQSFGGLQQRMQFGSQVGHGVSHSAGISPLLSIMPRAQAVGRHASIGIFLPSDIPSGPLESGDNPLTSAIIHAGPEQAVTAGPSTAVSPIVERAKKKYRRCTPLFRNDGTDYLNDEELAAKRAQDAERAEESELIVNWRDHPSSSAPLSQPSASMHPLGLPLQSTAALPGHIGRQTLPVHPAGAISSQRESMFYGQQQQWQPFLPTLQQERSQLHQPQQSSAGLEGMLAQPQQSAGRPDQRATRLDPQQVASTIDLDSGVLNDDADDLYGISEDAIPSSEPRRNAKTFPSAPLYPESTLPEMSLPPHAQSSHSPHPAYASGMAAMQAPGPSAYDIPGPSPAEPAGPSAPHVQDLPSGPGPSYQVPAPAGPSSAAPPMHDNQAAGNQPVAAHFTPIFAQPIPPAAILNAPAKPAGRGAPPGRGKNCNDCWAYDCEQVFTANDNKCDPHAVPRVPLKGGHNCPHPGHFKKVQDENHPLRIIMNRAIKPSGSANRARHKAA
ncbi:hypothetical protein WJX84_000899 [Apatococcus fuscideae]|uniref:Uncharacterized protein n=1 Tax=Apatococcus fuscideae TaxID=2026836 RepID=A0AAW1TKQ7_9CHLO